MTISSQAVLCLVLLAVSVMGQDYTNDFFLQSNQAPRPASGRTNRGPVLFPTSPEGTETSGVIIGASGYGFVQPNRLRAGPIFPSPRVPQGFQVPSGPNYGGFF